MTPSNANTSGLDCARIVACHLPEPHCPDTVCLPITITAGDLRAVYSVLVTAASAQARIAEFEAELEEARTIDAGFWTWLGERDLQPDGPDLEWGDIVVALTEHEDNAYDIAQKADDRATAAEARADRLAKVMAGFGGLADMIEKNTKRDRVKIDGEWHKGPSATAYIQLIEEVSLTARAALQQEG